MLSMLSVYDRIRHPRVGVKGNLPYADIVVVPSPDALGVEMRESVQEERQGEDVANVSILVQSNLNSATMWLKNRGQTIDLST